MREDDHENEPKPARPDRKLDLTIRATNGAIWQTDDFKNTTKVRRLVKAAVEHFVREAVMTDGDYRIALLVGGVAQPPLDESAELGDVGVRDGAVLVLIAREPQVDGAPAPR